MGADPRRPRRASFPSSGADGGAWPALDQAPVGPFVEVKGRQRMAVPKGFFKAPKRTGESRPSERTLAQARFARNLRRQAESSTSYRTRPTERKPCYAVGPNHVIPIAASIASTATYAVRRE